MTTAAARTDRFQAGSPRIRLLRKWNAGSFWTFWSEDFPRSAGWSLNAIWREWIWRKRPLTWVGQCPRSGIFYTEASRSCGNSASPQHWKTMNKAHHEKRKSNGGWSPCPSPETLAKFFRNELSDGERESLIDHLLVCPECRAKIEVLDEIRQDVRARKRDFRNLVRRSRREARLARGRQTSALGRFPRRTRAWAAAALLFAAAGAVTYSVFSSRAPIRVVRSAGGEAMTLRRPLVLSDGKTILFRWETPPGGENYWFRLIDDSLNDIVPKTSLKTALYVLHMEKLATRIVPGKTYIWTVEAFDDMTKFIARSEAVFAYQGK